MSPAIERLRGIKTFPQLLDYLRDELDWPIESNDTENVTFDYEASELGLDEKSAVRIKEIKQLRPLSGNQPWGIFFVNFEKKRLPVMVMRRILRSLVFKKRTAAGKSERQAWNASDLLFVSSYGEENDRAITFAHFVEDEDLSGLAELRVLGWDDDDTPLKYDYVAHTLREKLRWRDEYERKPDEWRNHWRSAFELRHREAITTSKQLASQLANLAKKIRARVRSVLRYEDGFGQIRKLHNAFKKALIHDLSDDDFADMYAQTITYGLFSAAVSRPAGIHGENIVDMVPVTNPFLRDMLQTFLNLSGRKGRIDFDELGIQEVVTLLNSPTTHLDAVLRDFGNRTQREDPVIHFYEDFLREYDARKKIQRGVFYTPQPVVSFIVRSVHELLQTEFGLEDGLADTTTWREMAKKRAGLAIPEGVKPEQPFVQILDPATGTATFLVEVIDVIYRHLKAKWEKGGLKPMPSLPISSFPRLASAFAEYWNQYVALALLPRLHGYELMMAPYAIAHMKVGLKLFETGYRFGSGERAHIYLTNALEPANDLAEQPEFEAWAPALAHEAKAVNAVKRHKRFTVVIGNPPYSVLSSNNGDWIQELLADFRQVDGQPLGERNSQSLQDDYVKFMRLVTHCIGSSGSGVLGFITPHGFLDNPTFRGMRQQLARRFTKLRFLDLHGNANKKEKCPDGSPDQNVFDILQGTAISVFAKTEFERAGDSAYAELWGARSAKYRLLSTNSVLTVDFEQVAPQPPHFLFLPRDYGLYETFSSWPPITDLMPVWNNGLMTSRDDFVFGFNETELLDRLRDFADNPLSEGSERYGLRDVREMTIKESQAALRRIGNLRAEIKPCLYRPMDVRRLFYHQCLVRWPVFGLMREMSDGKNLGLVTSRMTKGETFAHVMATRHPVEKIALSSKTSNNAYLFPLVVHRRDAAETLFSEDGRSSVNLSAKHIPEWFRKMGNSTAVAVGCDGNPNGSAIQVFTYFFAILQAPSYRSQYAEFLRGEYPRLPLTGNLELFRALARIGGELVALHLLESPKLDKPRTEFIGGRNREVEKISWSKNTVWIDKAQTTGFKGVPEAVWTFHIGGYQVCQKWLKDRSGRTLSKHDIAHYHKIVIALAETISLMAEIDKVIEKHGGWPAAFEAKPAKILTMVQFPILPEFDRIPLKHSRNYWLEFIVACFQLSGDDLTLPLLWEAHLVALEISKYKTELASVVGDAADAWLRSLKAEPVESGIFREVLDALAGNGNIERIGEKGQLRLVMGKTTPIIPGDWRLYDAAAILAMLNARPDVVDLEQLRTSSETGYSELEKILA